MLTKSFALNYLIIAFVIVAIFVGGMFTGAWMKEEHARAQRVKELKMNMSEEGLSNRAYIEYAEELRRISR